MAGEFEALTGIANAGLGIWDRIAAEEALARNRELYRGITEPSAADLAVNYAAPEYAGDLSVDELGGTDLENIDPRIIAAQDDALAMLAQRAGQKGLGAGDVAKMRMADQAAAAQNRAMQGAIGQNAAARGISGSGVELMNRQIAAQQAAQSRAMAGNQLASDAEDRALQSLSQYGQMGAQRYGQAAGVAQARDAIARYNNQAVNAARERNLNARQQQLAAAAARNQSAESWSGARQNQFANRMQRAAGESGNNTSAAGMYANLSRGSLRDAGDWFTKAGL